MSIGGCVGEEAYSEADSNARDWEVDGGGGVAEGQGAGLKEALANQYRLETGAHCVQRLVLSAHRRCACAHLCGRQSLVACGHVVQVNRTGNQSIKK